MRHEDGALPVRLPARPEQRTITRMPGSSGYTPDLLAVVWVGFDNKAKLGLSGAQAALPIWTEFMKRATARTPITDFVPPPGIKIVEIDPLERSAGDA